VAGCAKEELQASGAQPVEVAAVTVEARTIPVSYEFVGQAVASQTVEIRARIQGFLLKRHFEEGGRVKEGQVLYNIDPREFEANLQNYQARLANAEAQADRWEREVGRLKEMLATHGASQKEFDDAQSNFDSYTAEARMQKANIARAELDLSYATIKSPLTGAISRSLKDDGSLVDGGANSMLTTVTQLDPISVYFNISERDLLSIRAEVAGGKLKLPPRNQMRVVVSQLDGSVYPQEGRIDFADVQIDPQTGTAAVRADVPNPNEKLIPGQFVKVRLEGAERVNAIAVPQRAVQQSPAGAFVYVVAADGKVEQRPIRVGPWDGQNWVVDSGLAAGERVIVDGVQRVQPGMVVQVAAFTAGTAATQPTTIQGSGT